MVIQAGQVDIKRMFGLPESARVIYKKVNANNFWLRIFYEQLVMPWFLKGFDIYFSPTPVMPYLSKVVNGKLQHVVTIHDMIPFFVPRKYGKVRSMYIKLISVYSSRFADDVITVSENSKKDIYEIAHIDKAKVSVVYNFMPAGKTSRRITHSPFFVSISTIEPGKNIENTILGFKKFISDDRFRHYKFYWVGKIGWGYTEEELRTMISTTGVQDSFTLLGYIDDQKKDELLSQCAALVYLSHYEGFGLPVLEGLYFNKPAVVSNTSSLPEVIGKAGVLCNKENVDDIASALTNIVTHLDNYIGEIPIQLKKFDEQSQISTFLRVLKISC